MVEIGGRPDGVSDIDIAAEIAFHQGHRKVATVAIVRPGGRFGAAQMAGDAVTSFQEKPEGESGWINAGFFVLSPNVFDLIDGDSTICERAPMERLAASNRLIGFKHLGFWHAVDTLRDKQTLEELRSSGNAPWIDRA
jgi:glucose-1-phosphate cytidylyltransferase